MQCVTIKGGFVDKKTEKKSVLLYSFVNKS